MHLANRFLLALLALGLLPTMATAAPEKQTVRWYDVEVIVFRNVDPRTNETWPLDRGMPDVENIRPLYPPDDGMGDVQTAALNSIESNIPTAAPTPYTPLPYDRLTLKNAYAALDRSSRYEPILHFAWAQPPLAREQSPMVRVTLPGALDRKAEEEPVQDVFGDEFRIRQQEDIANESVASGFARPLDGRIQVGVGHYLHVDLDLLYLPEDINPEIVEGALPAAEKFMESRNREREARMEAVMQALSRGDISSEEAEILMLEPEDKVFHGFRLQAVRRVRSGELHYFDHPVFGALVVINPREVDVTDSGMN